MVVSACWGRRALLNFNRPFKLQLRGLREGRLEGIPEEPGKKTKGRTPAMTETHDSFPTSVDMRKSSPPKTGGRRRESISHTLQLALSQTRPELPVLSHPVALSDLTSPDQQGWLFSETDGTRYWCVVADMLFCMFEEESSEQAIKVLVLPGYDVKALTFQSEKVRAEPSDHGGDEHDEKQQGTLKRARSLTTSGMGRFQFQLSYENFQDAELVFSAEDEAEVQSWVEALTASSELDPDFFTDSGTEQDGESSEENAVSKLSAYKPSPKQARKRMDLVNQSLCSSSDSEDDQRRVQIAPISSLQTPTKDKGALSRESSPRTSPQLSRKAAHSPKPKVVSKLFGNKSPMQKKKKLGVNIVHKVSTLKDKVTGQLVRSKYMRSDSNTKLEDAVISGQLHRKGKLSWSKCYCIVSGRQLYCYKSHKMDSEPDVVVSFAGASVESYETEKRPHAFKITEVNGKTTFLSAMDSAELNRWMTVLKAAVYTNEENSKTFKSSFSSSSGSEPQTPSIIISQEDDGSAEDDSENDLGDSHSISRFRYSKNSFQDSYGIFEKHLPGPNNEGLLLVDDSDEKSSATGSDWTGMFAGDSEDDSDTSDDDDSAFLSLPITRNKSTSASVGDLPVAMANEHVKKTRNQSGDSELEGLNLEHGRSWEFQEAGDTSGSELEIKWQQELREIQKQQLLAEMLAQKEQILQKKSVLPSPVEVEKKKEEITTKYERAQEEEELRALRKTTILNQRRNSAQLKVDGITKRLNLPKSKAKAKGNVETEALTKQLNELKLRQTELARELSVNETHKAEMLQSLEYKKDLELRIMEQELRVRSDSLGNHSLRSIDEQSDHSSSPVSLRKQQSLDTPKKTSPFGKRKHRSLDAKHSRPQNRIFDALASPLMLRKQAAVSAKHRTLDEPITNERVTRVDQPEDSSEVETAQNSSSEAGNESLLEPSLPSPSKSPRNPKKKHQSAIETRDVSEALGLQGDSDVTSRRRSNTDPDNRDVREEGMKDGISASALAEIEAFEDFIKNFSSTT
ncbi:IPCEF1 [Branchiostoma lanceolatum]|uniref:IPCEF1 protein n=1 Tax=Branchiostoma lanceolatum TaxID=7740 RepID=A0A8J9YRD1_BRALA|nr:IPCEF1 [Branchiostoma lanceolatum]